MAVVDDFVTTDNWVPKLLGAGFDYVIDAIDSVRVKVAMIAFCRGARCAGGDLRCGGRGRSIRPRSASMICRARSRTRSSPRCAGRQGHGFTRDLKKKFGVEAVYSTEPLRYPRPAPACEPARPGPAGLNCAGFGSMVTVTPRRAVCRGGRSTRWRRRDEERRVHRGAVEINAPVQVRAGGAAALLPDCVRHSRAPAGRHLHPLRWRPSLTKPWPWSTKTVFPLK